MKKITESTSREETFTKQYANVQVGKTGNDEISFLQSFIDFNDPATVIITTDYFEKGKENKNNIQNVVSLDSLNAISSINNFISDINDLLPEGGLMACKFYPDEVRREAIRRKYDNSLMFHLVCLGNYVENKIYSLFEKPESQDNKVNLPFAEALGRVAAGGFKVLDYKQFDKYLYFVARKVSIPSYDSSESNSLIFKMKRIGKGGRQSVYYKFRTMYLYAEYLQNFVYQQNGLENGDKIVDDFRVTEIGNFLRKYWLDELPMLINLLKGDLKLVGVRPLTTHKFSLYSKNLQKYRTKFKPGLIPPFYADMPQSLNGLMESEMRYLKAYEKRPLKTDVKYFFKTLYNILLKGARSR